VDSVYYRKHRIRLTQLLAANRIGGYTMMHTFAPKQKISHPAKSDRSKIQGRGFVAQNYAVSFILQLQRTIGNHAVQRVLQFNAEEFEAHSATHASSHLTRDFSRLPLHAYPPTNVQPKLEVNVRGDKYEQEADRVAEQVMRMPDNKLQRTCAFVGGCTSCQEEYSNYPHVQTMGVHSHRIQEAEVPPEVNEVLRSPGQALDVGTRNFMESRFGQDFSQVRVHTDAKAAKSVRGINAVAYTAGRDIVFGADKSPGRDALTAHELTHVLQQTGHNGPDTVRASTIFSSIVQRQCTGSVGNPTSYASGARGPHLRCDQNNTGISDVTSRITAGRQRARVMIDDTLAVLNRMLTDRSASADALTHFRRLFRLSDPQPTDGQIRQAIGIYNRICTWLTTPPATNGGGILCLTQGIGACRGRYVGWATCTTGSVTAQPIMLCPGGITSNSIQTAETIIHEAAHHYGICTEPPHPGAPPPRERYEGEAGFPTSAALRTSADSYSAFAREAHTLRISERGEERRRLEAETGMTERPIRSRRRR
jgi:hypothetical protein